MILSMSRTIAVALPFAAAGILGAGCGSGHNTTPTTSAGARPAISKSRAQAYAHEVNLAAADIPGATVLSLEHETGEPPAADVELARCTGGVSPRLRVANIASAKFRIGRKAEAVRVKSSVEVMPTAALAAQNYGALASARGRACIEHVLPQTLEGSSTGPARVGPATISRLPNLLAPGTESFGVRVSTTFTGIVRGRQIRLRVYLDVFDLLAGPAEVGLSLGGIVHPPPRAAEQRLLSLLYTRAETHKL
jgi:hypothetical protein